MRKINYILMKIERAVGVTLLIAMFIIISCNMFSRYVLNKPIYWSDELSAFIYVWTVFLSCSYVMGMDGHIRIKVLEDHFSPRLKLITRILANAAGAFMFIYLIGPTLSTFPTLGKAMALRFPLRYVYIILPLAFGLMGFHCINNIIIEISELKENKGDVQKSTQEKEEKS